MGELANSAKCKECMKMNYKINFMNRMNHPDEHMKTMDKLIAHQTHCFIHHTKQERD